MNKLASIPRRLTAAQQALVEAPTSKALVAWAVELVRRHALSADLDEMRALAFEAMVLSAPHHRAEEAAFTTFARKRVFGHIFDALRKELTARSMASTAALDAMMRQYGVLQAQERTEMSTPDDRPDQARARVQQRMARLSFELFVPSRLDAVDPETRLIASAEEKTALVALRETVAELPSEEAAIIHRHYVEQLPLRQIADELGVSHSTVKRLHRRARASMRKALAARGITAAPVALDSA